MWGSGFKVDGAGCRVQSSEYRVQGAGLGNAGRMVQGSRFTIYGSAFSSGRVVMINAPPDENDYTTESYLSL